MGDHVLVEQGLLRGARDRLEGSTDPVQQNLVRALTEALDAPAPIVIDEERAALLDGLAGEGHLFYEDSPPAELGRWWTKVRPEPEAGFCATHGGLMWSTGQSCTLPGGQISIGGGCRMGHRFDLTLRDER